VLSQALDAYLADPKLANVQINQAINCVKTPCVPAWLRHTRFAAMLQRNAGHRQI